MTPKEKAKELFDKFCFAIKTEGDEFGYWTNTIQAKNCALIAVEECLQFEKSIVQQLDEISKEAFKLFVCEAKFWHSVKEEIKKL